MSAAICSEWCKAKGRIRSGDLCHLGEQSHAFAEGGSIRWARRAAMSADRAEINTSP
jgi:hypothetical protein